MDLTSLNARIIIGGSNALKINTVVMVYHSAPTNLTKQAVVSYTILFCCMSAMIAKLSGESGMNQSDLKAKKCDVFMVTSAG